MGGDLINDKKTTIGESGVSGESNKKKCGKRTSNPLVRWISQCPPIVYCLS